MHKHIFLLLASTTLLSACGAVKNPLVRTLPDETQVIAGPNLSLPPSYELRPPREGDANEALLRAPSAAVVSGTATATGAESWLINQAQSKAGTVRDANIRTDLEMKAEEDSVVAKEEKAKQGLLQRWFGK